MGKILVTELRLQGSLFYSCVCLKTFIITKGNLKIYNILIPSKNFPPLIKPSLPPSLPQMHKIKDISKCIIEVKYFVIKKNFKIEGTLQSILSPTYPFPLVLFISFSVFPFPRLSLLFFPSSRPYSLPQPVSQFRFGESLIFLWLYSNQRHKDLLIIQLVIILETLSTQVLEPSSLPRQRGIRHVFYQLL